MNAKRAQEFLQREVGDPKLRVRWREDIERFEVGRLVSSLASDWIEWFYMVTDGNDGYRPVDMRTVRKILSLDTWKRDKTLTVDDFITQIEDQKLDRERARAEVIRYRLKHESRYIKRAAYKDGIV